MGGKAKGEQAAGPRYMVCGVGGFDLSHGFVVPKPDWVAMRSDRNYGHCMFDVHSDAKMEWKYVSADKGIVLASVIIEK